MVTVKNKRNGAQSEMTKKDWEELQANPNYNGMFVEVKPKVVAEPEEVKQLNKRKAAKPEATEPAVTEQPEQTEQHSTDIESNGK